tara:strand:- start:62 stop:397 length:336 start_codon:yes stop_codon:yes gene_type:complete
MVARFENSSYKDEQKYLEYKKRARQRETQRIRNHLDSILSECLFCGSKEDLVFHHVNASEKVREVANAGSVKRINEEVVKCWCLCESCHTKLHQRLCDPLPSAYDTRVSVP